MTSVPGRSYEGQLPSLSAAQQQLAGRLEQHVRTITQRPHNIYFPDELEAVAGYLEAMLQSMGYAVQRQPYVARGHQVRNLEVVVEPGDKSAATLVVGAHYDSAGAAPGANDNGTGVAAVLELARALADLRGKAACRIRLVLFVTEEPPFFKREEMGILVYARRLAASGEKVAGMLSLETLGYYSDRPGSQHYPQPFSAFYPDRGNFVAFVGTIGSRRLVRETVRGVPGAFGFSKPGRRGAGLHQRDHLLRPLVLRESGHSRTDGDRHGAVPLSALPQRMGHARQGRLRQAGAGGFRAGAGGARLHGHAALTAPYPCGKAPAVAAGPPTDRLPSSHVFRKAHPSW
jgi:hypothetical protein